MNQDLENLALMIDGTPEIQMLTRNPDDHFGRNASGRSTRRPSEPLPASSPPSAKHGGESRSDQSDGK
jgi:hypothetical protein